MTTPRNIFAPCGLITFNGDADFKAQFIGQIKWHQDQDKLVRGSYWDGEKGCAVGCSIESLQRILKPVVRYDHTRHALYESLIGVPESIARLEDAIFELLPLDVSKHWPLRFVEAIPVGVDLGAVTSQFLLWILDDEKFGVKRYVTGDGLSAIESIIALYKRAQVGEITSIDDWATAESEAASRASRAAFQASRAASWAASAASRAAFQASRAASWAASAASGAASAAGSAASKAASAASGAASWAATAYLASRAAREMFAVACADKLVELILACVKEPADGRDRN